MDLIDNIKEILTRSGLNSPIFDLRFDNQNSVVGYVADEFFENKSDEESQKMIWDSLKKRLEPEELLKVLAIFHETPYQRRERLTGYLSKNVKHSNLWIHKAPDLAKYWLFIDVEKFGNDYKSFFLIINHKDNFKKELTFTYNKEVIDFMELHPEEIYNELYTNTYGNAESEIKAHLMEKHENLIQKGLWGKSNMYNYVFEKFEMVPIPKNQLIFSEEEIGDIKEGITQVKDKFKILTDINDAIGKSELINKLKGNLLFK